MIKRLFAVYFVLVVLAIASIKNRLGSLQLAYSNVPPALPPTHHTMIQHLENEHGISMGTRPDSDILLRVEGDLIRVVFQPAFLSRMRGNLLSSMEMRKPDLYVPKERFNQFLYKFHSCLNMGMGPTRERVVDL
ncbi:MAG: hypothetical protein KC931_13270 [Candidatus Omnitrophica bacterium]|nr:hypothetical protein [Candidatus Omnitrophota bacterium]MCA9448081.1 hypothetical protein [Candidatus Omnitrophota bacterium]MCB9783416.1 hypothetical protein [Candidatus Omnitrophota bacterium]